MTILRDSFEDHRQDGHIIYYLIKAFRMIYKGAITCTRTPVDGYLRRGLDFPGYVFAGIAVEDSPRPKFLDHEHDGDRGVRVYRNGVFQLPCVGADQTWVGRQVFCVDDNTVGIRQQVDNGILVGVVVGYISSTLVKVDICCATMGMWTEESWSSSSSSSSSSSFSSSSSSSSFSSSSSSSSSNSFSSSSSSSSEST